MQGLMMDRPLRIIDILLFAAEVHPAGEIVSVRDEGDRHRLNYREVAGRVAQLAHALRRLGIGPGDRVATLAFNGHRHFELYYAISGIGAVCHTINPRLPPTEIRTIVEHAKDSAIFVDLSLVPLLETLAPLLPDGITFVVMTGASHAPQSELDLLVYETLLADEPTMFDWPDLDERTAAGLCYTSGTTGVPKGALYSHRSTVLHALFVANSLPEALKPRRRIMPVVPLFHVCAWGVPFMAPLTGASLVLPGAKLDGASLFALMDREEVYSAWGVPTVWLALLQEIDRAGRLPEGFGDVLIGGSAAPRAMIERFEALGVNVCHAWGMTEMSPVGTVGNLTEQFDGIAPSSQLDQKAKQGRRIFGLDMKITDENGAALPHDGTATGALSVRGNTVISAYYEDEVSTKAAFDDSGWFSTGDVASIDGDGFLKIVDRTKDMIKSGGEWISSIALENAAIGDPGVANCAAIAIAHPRWGERPLLVVVPRADIVPDKAQIRERLAARFASWQLPDDIVFVDALPVTATGKISKRALREQFRDYDPARPATASR